MAAKELHFDVEARLRRGGCHALHGVGLRAAGGDAERGRGRRGAEGMGERDRGSASDAPRDGRPGRLVTRPRGAPERVGLGGGGAGYSGGPR